jgi:hypothetical protein
VTEDDQEGSLHTRMVVNDGVDWVEARYPSRESFEVRAL